jgi:hypothetical protein
MSGVTVPRRTRFGTLAVAFAGGVVVTLLAVALIDPRPTTSPSSAAPVPSPSSILPGTPSAPASPEELLRIGGVPAADPVRTIDPLLMPYRYLSPTPPPTPTELDGTYMRTLTLRDVGGARVGLPSRCLRCPPYRIDAGVTTLIFFRGAYFLSHQLSGFQTQGSFVVDGDRVTLFNDPNCPKTVGVYEFELNSHAVRLRVVSDDCPFSGERSFDLMAAPWTHVSACYRRIQHLWPGAVAC